jgi:hypothetical protein
MCLTSHSNGSFYALQSLQAEISEMHRTTLQDVGNIYTVLAGNPTWFGKSPAILGSFFANDISIYFPKYSGLPHDFPKGSHDFPMNFSLKLIETTISLKDFPVAAIPLSRRRRGTPRRTRPLGSKAEMRAGHLQERSISGVSYVGRLQFLVKNMKKKMV